VKTSDHIELHGVLPTYIRVFFLGLLQKNGLPLIPGAGQIVFKDNIIKFDHVPLVTPNGDILVNDLTFEVKSGMNVLVCGPNGCGKSSLFRILGELWPLFGGVVTKPPRGKLFYIPQRPYMTLGKSPTYITSVPSPPLFSSLG